jgi:hypothetical protein
VHALAGRTRGRFAALLLLAASASGAEPAARFDLASSALRVRPADEPAWYRGLQLRIDLRDGAPAPFVFWPQEGVAVDGSFRAIASDQVARLRSDGASLRYEVRGIPDLELEVELRVEADSLHAIWAVRNLSARERHVSIAPCLQLPATHFGPYRGWARAKRVFVWLAEAGLTWVADTRQTPGRRVRPDDPDPASGPWAQHFAPEGVRREDAAGGGLALFGVAFERAAADVIGFAAPRGDLYVVAAADTRAGATYALLNCLHAGVGGVVPARGARRFEQRTWFHRGDFESLLPRVTDALGRGPAIGSAFLPPAAATRVVESFEDPRRAPPGALARAGRGFLAASDGELRLEARVAGGRPLRVELEAPRDARDVLAVSVDLAPLALAPAEVEVCVEAGGEVCASADLAPGRFRRVAVPLARSLPGAAFALRVAPRRGEARIAVDAVTLHLRPEPRAGGAPTPR